MVWLVRTRFYAGIFLSRKKTEKYELDKISRSGEDLIDSRYKKETKKDILDFPGNTVAV